jgi:hypothetical protein
VAQVVFEKFGTGLVSWGGLTTPRCQITEGRSNRPGQSEQVFALWHSHVASLHWFRGSVLWLRGSLHMHGGALCVVRALVWWLVLFA